MGSLGRPTRVKQVLTLAACVNRKKYCTGLDGSVFQNIISFLGSRDFDLTRDGIVKDEHKYCNAL